MRNDQQAVRMDRATEAFEPAYSESTGQGANPLAVSMDNPTAGLATPMDNPTAEVAVQMDNPTAGVAVSMDSPTAGAVQMADPRSQYKAMSQPAAAQKPVPYKTVQMPVNYPMQQPTAQNTPFAAMQGQGQAAQGYAKQGYGIQGQAKTGSGHAESSGTGSANAEPWDARTNWCSASQRCQSEHAFCLRHPAATRSAKAPVSRTAYTQRSE